MKKMTIDGNTAASYVAYAFSEVAAIYPITPSSPMAEYADEWASQGRLNMFGQKLQLTEMQSEAGAAGAVHGSLVAGALTTTFTASQGLLLMIPNMYKIAGELLPTVFHVSARSLATHALSIFGDHQDVMACRQTGFAMLASSSVQESLDLALVAHLATLKSHVPFLHFFDGFRTSHEINTIEAPEYEKMRELVDMKDIEDFRKSALNPQHPSQKGTAQNPDIYFQNREAANKYYENVPNIVTTMMDKVNKLTGRNYHLFDYYGSKDAENVIVIMGSGAEACEETIDYLMKKGQKVGMVKVRLYRPFSIDSFVNVLPKTVKNIAVLDRTKESGSIGEPLYLDVCAALTEKNIKDIKVYGGRYGLGSKEFNPSCINAVFQNLQSKSPKNHFTVGIIDDVTKTNIEIKEFINASPKTATRCKFYGLGSDGTVGANKNSIKIIGDHTDLYAQGYFVYDSKKSGGITISHLRFGKEKIKSTYLIDQADFVACHNQSYISRYDMISDLVDGGTFLFNTTWSDAELENKLPKEFKKQLAKKKIKFYCINALKIAQEAGMGKLINGVMQAAFFKLANIIPYDKASEYMKEAIKKTYAKKGDEVVRKNCVAVDMAIDGLREVKVPDSWMNPSTGMDNIKTSNNKYYKDFIDPILYLKGDNLPVSSFDPSGTVPTNTTQFEKRGIAPYLPEWISENCIQCNQCSFVCPHSCIRPTLLKNTEKTPNEFATIPATGLNDYKFRIQLSPLDCTGCGNCANICPVKNKALVMKPAAEVHEESNYEYSLTLPEVDVKDKFKPNTVKGSQFIKPLFEFSGACSGCGETAYIKTVTQLFGDRMLIANATGCSSIYGGSAPTCPFSVTHEGYGPAWGNSLFEDNAEYGFGMHLAYKARREKLKTDIEKSLTKKIDSELAGYFKHLLDNFKNAEETKKAYKNIMSRIDKAISSASDKETKELLKNIKNSNDCIIKKSVWIIGGDGWAYDIGYGGLDHVLAMNEDVNILVVDTEIYSNTGGQMSKSTQTGSIAKFAASGKTQKKKDLGMMAISYGNVYVAQVGMGANMGQLLKALTEAESYDGPSLVIAYSPCINQGIDMTNSQKNIKDAVDCGYWHLYRYIPNEGFYLDSGEPKADLKEYLIHETRYSALRKYNPELAEKLYELNKKYNTERYNNYKILDNERKNKLKK